MYVRVAPSTEDHISILLLEFVMLVTKVVALQLPV